MFVLLSAEPRLYTNDVDYVFRQENNLYYLTALKQAGAKFVLVPGNNGVTEVLFLPKRNPANETWNGRMYSKEDAQRISGIKTVLDSSEFPAFVEALKKKQTFNSAANGVSISMAAENLHLLLPAGQFDRAGEREFRQEIEFAKELQNLQPAPFKIVNAQAAPNDFLGQMRLIKSPYELKILQHAIDITTEAQMRAMATAERARHEYEVQAEVEYIFRRRNADFWGYPSIVGCGPNATTLHYVESQGEVKPNDLLLMDVGAEYDHYTADVTRTFPINGKFSKEQAEIYQIVYNAQEAVAAKTKPGASFKSLSDTAAETIKNGLAQLGLITAPNATVKTKLPNGQIADVPQYRLWFMHGLGHWLGMNVHDVGDYSTPLKPGMVFTNEPGIYIRADALDYLPDTPEAKEFVAKVRPAFEKYKNIGVRIEDDILVTETGAEWMTKNLPRKMAEIESLIARGSKEIPVSRIENQFVPKNRILGFDADSFARSERSFGIFDFETPVGKTLRSGFVGAAQNYAQQHSHE